MGDRATISDENGLLNCLECGQRCRNLETHLRYHHQITPDQYTATHGLPKTSAMMADPVRLRQQKRQYALLNSDPTALDHLRPWQDTDYLAALSRKGLPTKRETATRETVKEHLEPNWRKSTAKGHNTQHEKVEQAARTAGYTSFNDAITATAHLTRSQAATAIGVSQDTIYKWRKRTLRGE